MWMLQVPCWWEQPCTWKHVNGLGCAITDMFHFLQACGFWCQLLENDTSQLPLPNYILWLIFVYDLCMLKGQAALGWFIVVRTENRWGEHAGWNHCLAHLWGGCPWLCSTLGYGARSQYPAEHCRLSRRGCCWHFRSVGQAIQWPWRESHWPQTCVPVQVFFSLCQLFL